MTIPSDAQSAINVHKVSRFVAALIIKCCDRVKMWQSAL